MRYRLTLITALTAVLSFAGLIAVSRYDRQLAENTDTRTQGAAMTPSVATPIKSNRLQGLKLAQHTGNAYQYVLELFASLPSGTSLDQAQFDKALGSDAATFLRSINVTHIDSLNNTVHVTLSAAYDTTTSAAEIRLDPAVSFSFSENSAGTLICDQITGIDVNASWLLGWMPVKHAEILHDTAGNTTIEVEVSTLFGTVKRTIKLDPDGKTIP